MLQRKRRDSGNKYAMYSQDTDPALHTVTMPIPNPYYLREPWTRRFLRAIGNFITATVRKINQLIGFALAVFLLLLFVRFTLTGFDITTSLFAQWVFWLSDPPLIPFQNLLPPLPYNGFMIDTSLLIAIIAYFVGVTIIRQFLKLLVG